MTKIDVIEIKKKKLKNPVLIEGLPGIGNVGKIAVDFMIDYFNAEKIYDIHSYKFPHAVFVNESNLAELPVISVYHKKIKGKDILFLAGDVQPIDEEACYDFCENVVNLFSKIKGFEIITMGGIGLQRIPEKPSVYCTANDKLIVKKYKHKKLKNKIYGVVGPILGVTGLLVGLSKKKNIPAIALLAETFGHPNYFGIKGAREILDILNSKLDLGIDLDGINTEIESMEGEIKKKAKDLEMIQTKKKSGDINYIG